MSDNNSELNLEFDFSNEPSPDIDLHTPLIDIPIKTRPTIILMEEDVFDWPSIRDQNINNTIEGQQYVKRVKNRTNRGSYMYKKAYKSHNYNKMLERIRNNYFKTKKNGGKRSKHSKRKNSHNNKK